MHISAFYFFPHKPLYAEFRIIPKKAHKKEQGAGTTSTAATTTASNLSTTLSIDPLDVFSTLTSKESQA